MTTSTVPPETDQTPPATPHVSWGIAADLTPPELIAARKLRVVRWVVAAVVLVVLIAAAGGWYLASQSASNAQSDLANQQVRTQGLLNQQSSYAGVTRIQGTIAQVQTRIAGLMADDVDLSGLIGHLQQALPAGMTIGQVDIEITAAGSQASGNSGAGSLDATGATHIGTVTLTGTGHKLTDLSAYIAALQKVSGVFSPYPLVNQTTTTGTQYSLQLTLTDALLTHTYDVKAGK